MSTTGAEQQETSPVSPDAQYWNSLKAGRFMIQRSRGSGDYVFYPRMVAPGTGASDLEFVEVSGEAVVYSTTVVRQNAKLGGDFNVSVVQLAEGPRFVTRVLGCSPTAVAIGMKVKASIEKVDFGAHANSDQPVVVFRPTNQG
jgi:hypothetical protein